MTRTGERIYREQVNLWLEGLFEQENMSIKDMAEKLITAAGKTNENGAVNYILATPGRAAPSGQRAGQERPVRHGAGHFAARCGCSSATRSNARSATTIRSTPTGSRRLLGRQRLLPPDRAGRTGNAAPKIEGGQCQLTLMDNVDFNKPGMVFYEKRNGVFLPSEPVFLDGSDAAQERDWARAGSSWPSSSPVTRPSSRAVRQPHVGGTSSAAA